MEINLDSTENIKRLATFTVFQDVLPLDEYFHHDKNNGKKKIKLIRPENYANFSIYSHVINVYICYVYIYNIHVIISCKVHCIIILSLVMFI